MRYAALLLLVLLAIQATALVRLRLRIIDLEVALERAEAVARWRITSEFHEYWWHGRPWFVPYDDGLRYQVVGRTPTEGQNPSCN